MSIGIPFTYDNVTSYQHKHGSISFLPFDIIIASLCILLAFFILCFFCFCKHLRKRPPQDETSGSPEENISFPRCAVAWTFAEVEKATDGFSARRLVGRGSYGAVYRAILADGQVMAVKRIDPSHVLRHAGIFNFSAETRALSSAHHPNIVPLVGFCEAPGERIIGMPFSPGKSLQYHLHEGGMRFDWSRRANILSDVAQGIEYLHEGTAPYIIHGDIKPSNILLDSMWSARVADFGLAFLTPQNQAVGTVGYIDPEYSTQQNLSKASDVYSFGVVLLEMLSGRPCFGGEYIVDWAVPLITSSRTNDIFDPKLALPPNVEPLMRMAKLACGCVNGSRKNRPSISEVVAELKNIESDITASNTLPSSVASSNNSGTIAIKFIETNGSPN